MFDSVNEVSVLVTAILAVAVGSIWYSPLLFGDIWMRAVGITTDDLQATRSAMTRWVMSALLANLVLLFVLAEFIRIADLSGYSMWRIGAFVLIFIGASTASAVIWEKRPLSYLLIHTGYTAVVIFGGMSVIAFWPW